MADIMKLIQEADGAAIEMERARQVVEAAKTALDTAKESFEKTRSTFEQILVGADEVGVPRAKIKKLIEDRTSALVASGLIPNPDEKAKAPRSAKAGKKPAKNDLEVSDPETKPASSDINFDANEDRPSEAAAAH